MIGTASISGMLIMIYKRHAVLSHKVWVFINTAVSSSWSSWLSSSVMSKASIDLFWLHLIVSWKVFQLVFIHLVYNSVLFLASCCSFLLHLISNLIFIFVVSCQLVVLATLPKYLHSFCGQKGCYFTFLLKNFNLIDVDCENLESHVISNVCVCVCVCVYIYICMSQKVVVCVAIYINLKR
jgi:hypothetical protein